MKTSINVHGATKDTKVRFCIDKNGPITNSTKMPIFAATDNMDVKLPRMCAGEISPKYIGVAVKAMPVAKPDINLDIYSSYKAKKKIVT